MKLSIIVTRYKEDWNTCKSLFNSIATQRGINFSDLEVIVVNDGRDELLTGREWIGYPYHVDYLPTVNHVGVSGARNSGLDKATGDYVMFCDIDDMFLNNCGLHLLFAAMKEGYDFINSTFVEEQWRDGEYKLLSHDKDITFIHGKAYKRQWLIDKKIRFDEKLTIHEDGYFNVIAHCEAETIKTITTPFYMWKWNDNSVVRKDSESYVLKTYSNLMDCRKAICRELEKRGFIDQYINSVVKTVVDSYYDFQKPDALDPKNRPIVLKAKREFKKFYEAFGREYKESNINRIAEMMYVCREKAFVRGLRVEQQTIREFLNEIALL